MTIMRCAFVLGGGGGKGSYEIGVWKALEEMGYAKFFSGVLGTSVGALNGALFAQGKLAEAERVWLEEINPQRILTGTLTNLVSLFTKREIQRMERAGIFNQDGLREILERHLDSFPETPELYACVSEISPDSDSENPLDEKYTSKYIKINSLSREESVDSLLASAALPVVFPSVSLFNRAARDGGMLAAHNLPYHQAACMGYEKILAVSLGNEVLVSERLNISRERRNTPYETEPVPEENGGFSDALILCPTVSLGGLFTGTLDFSREGVRRRMELGYDNCMGIYRDRIRRFFERHN